MYGLAMMMIKVNYHFTSKIIDKIQMKSTNGMHQVQKDQ